jgi:DNA-binding Lrp family transcriptional regulator
MTIWDDRILELIRRDGSGSPTELAETEYIDVSATHVGRRLKRLAEHGMVRPLGNGVYVITEVGEAYLDGEVSAKNLDGNDGDESNVTA